MTRHWAINGRFLGQTQTGVQRCAGEIVRALDQLVSSGHPLASDLELELLIPKGVAPPVDLAAITVRTVPGGTGYVWEQGRLPSACTGGLVSLCNVGPLAKRHHILCIHDVNTRLAPQSYTFEFRLFYGALLPALGRSAQVVTTVSQFSATQLVRFGICRADKLRVIPNGHEHALRFAGEHTAATKAAAGRQTIVLMGSVIPHKNVGVILSMAQDLDAMGLRIAVVGSADRRVYQNGGGVAKKRLKNIVWLGRLEDNALAALLEDSLCLAFPSLAEGFGLPPLEAMALGCPVVASDRTSLPEICGSAALFAAPTDRDEWLCHFRSLARDERLRADLATRGRLQAARFRWSDAAMSYLDTMAQVDASARAAPMD